MIHACFIKKNHNAIKDLKELKGEDTSGNWGCGGKWKGKWNKGQMGGRSGPMKGRCGPHQATQPVVQQVPVQTVPVVVHPRPTQIIDVSEPTTF
jgi:hypothetical protein